MKIVWDETKRQSNLRNRGLDFADIPYEFFLGSRIDKARHGRLKAVGLFRDMVLTVIFKPLGSEAISIVSMRPASRTERKLR